MLEIIKQVILAIQTEARITVVIPPGAQVISSGGNAGGPIVTQGQTISFLQGGAILQ